MDYIRRFPKVSLNLLENIYEAYMKGSIMDYNIAYETAKSQIFSHLELFFDDFLKDFKSNEGLISHD